MSYLSLPTRLHDPPRTTTFATPVIVRLLQEIMRKGSRSRSPDSQTRDGTAKPWTHDLYEEVAGADR